MLGVLRIVVSVQAGRLQVPEGHFVLRLFDVGMFRRGCVHLVLRLHPGQLHFGKWQADHNHREDLCVIWLIGIGLVTGLLDTTSG